MKKALIGLIAGLTFVFAAPGAHAALFFVGADVPLQFDLSDGGSAEEISGLKATVTLPFFVGFGIEQYTATFNTAAVSGDVEVSMFDLFFNLPIPLVIIGLGAGVGKAVVDDTRANSGLTFEDADLTQVFVTLGLPIAALFDIHVGYHVLKGSSEVRLNGEKFTEVTLDGTMISLGIGFGF